MLWKVVRAGHLMRFFVTSAVDAAGSVLVGVTSHLMAGAQSVCSSKMENGRGKCH